MQRARIIIPSLLAALVFLGAGCSGNAGPVIKPVSLAYWSSSADAAAMQNVIAEYKKLHPNVEVTLTVMPEADYERSLLEALAEDRGPDIFTLPNTRLLGWQAKLLPMPEKIELPVRTVNDQQKIVTVNKATTLPTKGSVTRDFVETVPKDVFATVTETVAQKQVRKEKLFGLPISMDTPALFYNADLLKGANIKEPPATWREFQDQATKLTLKDADKTIRQSGAAFGLATNVLHATDILVSVMMQNGAEMTEPDTGRSNFQSFTKATSENAYPPGVEALIFYQSFADPFSQNYTWNSSQPSSMDAFITGKTAFFIGFPGDVATIRQRAPRLNFATTPLPLISESKKVQVAHYPVETVSAKTKHPAEAWDFLIFLAAPEQAGPYLATAKRPTALRSLIASQLTDADISTFAGQVLTARSWYVGRDYPKAVEAFERMIVAKPTERQPSYSPILNEAATAVDRTRL
jgi:multiple sugar transport system substrate-binding protein